MKRRDFFKNGLLTTLGLGAFGPGSEKLSGFVKNFELHNFMLEASGANRSLFS